MTTDPDYHEGDVIVARNGTGLGSRPFAAEHEPARANATPWASIPASGWWYRLADACCWRKATAADIDKYRDILLRERERLEAEERHLAEMERRLA